MIYILSTYETITWLTQKHASELDSHSNTWLTFYSIVLTELHKSQSVKSSVRNILNQWSTHNVTSRWGKAIWLLY